MLLPSSLAGLLPFTGLTVVTGQKVYWVGSATLYK